MNTPHDIPLDTAQLLSEEQGLRRVARRLLRDQADQDDLIQETWLASLQADADSSRDPGAWRKGILRNKTLKLLERRRRRADAQALLEAPTEARETDGQELDRASLRHWLQGAIGQLQPKQAEVIAARYFEEKSLSDISAHTGRPIATIKTQLARGLQGLRQRLDERTGDPRLTAVALIRGFEWEESDTLKSGAVASSAGWLVALWIAAGSLVVATVWFLSFLGSSPSEEATAELISGERVEGVVPDEGAVASLEEGETLGNSRDEVSVPAETDEPPLAATPEETEPDVLEEGDELVGEMLIAFVGLDENGAPRDGFHVKLWDPRDLDTPWSDPADADGLHLITVDENLLWRVPADNAEGTPLGLPTRESGSIRFSVQHPESTRLPILFVPFVPGTELEVLVNFDTRMAQVGGHVLDVQGEPIVGANVTAVGPSRILGKPFESEYAELHQTHIGFPVISGADGSFLLNKEPAGQVIVEAQAPGYVPNHRVLEVGERERQDIELVLEAAAPVTGIISDARGRPVADGRVLSDSLKNSPGDWARTAEDGSFRIDSLPPGRHRLWAYGARTSPSEHQVASAVLDLVAGETLEWSPTLHPAPPLQVVVVDFEGEPIEGLHVIFEEERGPFLGQHWFDVSVTDANGLATLWHPPELPIRVQIVVGDMSVGLSPVALRVLHDLRPAEEPTRVQLREGELELGSIRGQFVRADGTPFLGGTVGICQRELDEVHLLSSNPHEFEQSGMPGGDYLLLLEKRAGGYWSFQFHLKPGEDLDLGVIRAPSTGTLRVVNHWPESQGEEVYHYVFAAHLETFQGETIMNNNQGVERLQGDYELLPGVVSVDVYRNWEPIQERVVEITSNQVTEVVLGPVEASQDDEIPD